MVMQIFLSSVSLRETIRHRGLKVHELPRFVVEQGYAGLEILDRQLVGLSTQDMERLSLSAQDAHCGIVLDIGRPGIGTRLRDVEKIFERLVSLGIHFEEQNPLTSLLRDKNESTFKDEVLDEKVLSIIIEFKVSSSRLQELLDALNKFAAEIDTVFSVGLIDRVSDDGSMENYEQARHLGYDPSINAKVNIGVGRPQARSRAN